MNKKIICLLLAILFAVSLLTACGSDNDGSSSSDSEPSKNDSINATIKTIAYGGDDISAASAPASEQATDAAVTEPSDSSMTATPSSSEIYTVIYCNSDGTEFVRYRVKEGDPVPVPDTIPTYEDDYYTYKFKSWDFDSLKDQNVDLDHLNANVMIIPKYDPVQK